MQEMPGNYFLLLFRISIAREMPGENSLARKRERAEENDPPKVRAIFEMLEPRKPKVLLQK